MVNEQHIIPHLFRTEHRKIVSVLTHLFGLDQIEIAEDIVADTFLIAIETWGLKGLPENPTAWLYKVAKNNAKTYLQRDAVFQKKITPSIRQTNSEIGEIEIDLSEKNINDSQLQMMFAICHPCLTKEAQVCLALRVLCGLGIEEIADAFLSNKETINKRLLRAKEKLRSEKVKLELPPENEINERLDAVLVTIYLLFNEGYYSMNRNSIIRKELCLEAIRLCHMLAENNATNQPAANALLSLMCFHASRFEARVNSKGEFILFEDQDVNLWNAELIEKGEYYLSCSAKGNVVSKYHLEAAIAFWHTSKYNAEEKWENILQLYNQLLQIEYSPMAALNRTYALSKANGKEPAITEAKKLALTNNYLYFVLMGELYNDIENSTAREYFRKALSLAKTQNDKQIIQNKINSIEPV